jgi:N-acetylglucosamine kinase-like BadF-type ATPase
VPNDWVVGVDVGGTKTHVRVECGAELLADYVLSTTSWWGTGSPIEAAANAAALVRALGDDGRNASAIVVGAHGVDSDRAADDLAAELRALVPGKVRVLNDAAPSAGHVGPVITVISGTGSIVLALDADGHEVRLGGHGYLLGDEGSAPALVRDLVRELLRALDRGHADEIALRLLCDAVGLAPSAEPEEDLAARLHQHHSITDWGRLAPAVFVAADQGSRLARAVVAQHAAELVELIELHLARGVDPEAVVLAGGVVTNQPRLADAIRDGVHRRHPALPVVLLAHPPVEGAILLARRLLDHTEDLRSVRPATELETTTAQHAAQPEGSRL